MTSGIPNEKEWLNTKEVAEYLGVGRMSIQRWCGSGYLRGVKIGKSWRIHRDEIEDPKAKRNHPREPQVVFEFPRRPLLGSWMNRGNTLLGQPQVENMPIGRCATPSGVFTLPTTVVYNIVGGKWCSRLVLEREIEIVDAPNGKIVVSRELLSSLLENLEARANHTPLSPRERKALEQLAVAVTASGEDEIAICGDLLDRWRSSSTGGVVDETFMNY